MGFGGPVFFNLAQRRSVTSLSMFVKASDCSRPLPLVVFDELQCSSSPSLSISIYASLNEASVFERSAAELLTTNKLSELACLALYLMYEKKQGKESYWYPYIRELDRQRGRGQLAVESPLLWSREELNEYFAGSTMKVLPTCACFDVSAILILLRSPCYLLNQIRESVT